MWRYENDTLNRSIKIRVVWLVATSYTEKVYFHLCRIFQVQGKIWLAYHSNVRSLLWQCCLIYARKNVGPNISNDDTALHIVTFCEWRELSYSCCCLLSVQYRKCYLLMKPVRWMWASSLIHNLCTLSLISLIRINIYWQ